MLEFQFTYSTITDNSRYTHQLSLKFCETVYNVHRTHAIIYIPKIFSLAKHLKQIRPTHLIRRINFFSHLHQTCTLYCTYDDITNRSKSCSANKKNWPYSPYFDKSSPHLFAYISELLGLMCPTRHESWHTFVSRRPDMGRYRHGPRSTWAEINMGRSRWAEIDVGRDRRVPLTGMVCTSESIFFQLSTIVESQGPFVISSRPVTIFGPGLPLP